jgi:riboflavin kinase/FMN adenylyltransferase
LSNRIHLANKLLGRFYHFSGKVTRGQQLGRKIGFPTANLEIAEDYKLVPSDVAYAVLVTFEGKTHRGMMNIGFKPTIGSAIRTIEINIFNFEQDLYHKDIQVQVVKQIRPEIKFKNLDELSIRLKQDGREAMAILDNISGNEHSLD